MARQLVFDLARAPGFDRDDFLVSAANEAAVAAIQTWPDWPGRTLLVTGPTGSGKSHLAAIWAADVGATVAGSLDFSLWDGGGRSVLLEDCDSGKNAEPAFFHALNLVRETGGWLLMTARSGPRCWGIRTPDLLSRLRLSPIATIHPPDSELMKAVLIKLFADRQIFIDEDVIAYAARHCEHSLEAVNRFVAAVDEAALATGRRITRPLAAHTLASLQASDTDGPYGPM